MPARTITYKDFRQGIDLSRGRYPDDYTIFRGADNAVLTTGKKARMRYPRRRLDVILDSQTQGFNFVGCGLVVIAPRGSTILHDGPDASLVNTLYFDVPDNMGPGWTLRGAWPYRNRLVVAIAHEFAGCGINEQILYHTLDPTDPTGAERTKPSYWEDPWAPTNWNAFGTRPLHLYGKGEVGVQVTDYTPVGEVAAERMFLNRPDGDAAFSGVSSATTRQLGERVWNPFKVQDLQDFGEMWYFQIPDDGTDLHRFTVSDRFDKLDDDRAWSAYVLEYLDADGYWRKAFEVAEIPSLDGQYTVAPVDQRWGAGYNEICLLVRLASPCAWIRWRAMVGGPPLSLLEGGDYFKDEVPDQQSFAGDDATTVFDTTIIYRHDTIRDFANDYQVRLERTIGTTFDVPLIPGQEWHFKASPIDIITEDWATGIVTAAGTWVTPTTANNYIYRANNAGTTGGGEPVWPTEDLETVNDNGIIWEAYSLNSDGEMATARITFNKFRDQIRLQCDDTLESSYLTNIRFDTIHLVPQFVPILVLNAAEDVLVSDADYILTDDDGYIRVTWTQNLPAQGTVWTLKFPPTSNDEVIAACTKEHFTSGTYLFEQEIWDFQAIPLTALPADTRLYAGIPHLPLVLGADVQNEIVNTSGPFQVPAGVTKLRVEVWGAGGGGGGAVNFQSYLRLDTAAGGGGGGGAYTIEEIAVTPGEILTIDVGAGGAGGTSRQTCFPCGFTGQNCGTITPGGNGGNTRILRGITVLLEVAGGQGGSEGTSSGGIFPNPVGGVGGLGGVPITPVTGDSGDDGDDGQTKSRFATWPEPPAASGGQGGFSGAGDLYGRGGEGARGHAEGDAAYDCGNPPPYLPVGQDGAPGRVKITWGGIQDPWFVPSSPSAIPLNGWQRYHFFIKKILTTNPGGEIIGDEDYLYGNHPNKESLWFIQKTAQYEQDAGYLDAGVVGSASRAQACGNIVAMSAINNRLAIHYSNFSQLWAVNINPTDNQFLDDLPFGSRGKTAQFYGGSMVLCQDAFRFMDLGGLNYDSLRENHYGRPIERITIESILEAQFWPYAGAYVSIVMIDGELRIIFFTMFRGVKVMAWTTASVRDLGVPVGDSLVAVDDRLYWREGDLVVYFDGSAELRDGRWYDDTDLEAYEAAILPLTPAEAANVRLEDFKYKSRIRFHHNDLAMPGSVKRWLWSSREQTGRSVMFYRNSPDEDAKIIRGPSADGETLTGRRHPIHMMSEGLTVELESTDLDGWELDQVILGVIASRR